MIDLRLLSDKELWELLAEIAQILDTYKFDAANNKFNFWYRLFKRVQAEIDTRLFDEWEEEE